METKGKGLPATKVGGMRVPAHHEHPPTQPAVPAEALIQTSVATGEFANKVVVVQ